MTDGLVIVAVLFVLLCLVLAWDSVWLVRKRNSGKGGKFTNKNKKKRK